MTTYLYILSGALKGYKLKMQPGLTIGRDGSHYNLKDSKTSDIHCVVAERGGGLFLVDNSSKNGLWLGDSKVDHIELKNKVRLKIGRTHIEVRQKVAGSREEKPVKKLTWQDSMKKELHRFKLIQGAQAEATCLPMTPPLKLKFTRGLQTDDTWVIGYGPRKVGSAGHELNILETDSPEECFELKPTDEGCLLTTQHTDVIKVNGKNVSECLLNDKDEIEILNAKIKVEFFQ